MSASMPKMDASLTGLVELLREKSPRKHDFDACLMNWDNLPNRSDVVWNALEWSSYRKLLLKLLEDILTGPEIVTDLPIPVMQLLDDSCIHPMTVLYTVNNSDKFMLGKAAEGANLLRQIVEYWMKKDHMTKILLSFILQPDSPRKMCNVKQYFGVLFASGEKFIGENEFVSFLLEVIVVTLTVLAARQESCSLGDIYSQGFVTFIERIFVRYYAAQHRHDVNPFVVFMENLIYLCQTSSIFQVTVSGFLIKLPRTIQVKIVSLWLHTASSTRIKAMNPFYPTSMFMNDPCYQKTLLVTIPLSHIPNESISFWTNWGDYISTDFDSVKPTWVKFMDCFLPLIALTADAARLTSPVFAFAALAKAIIPRLSEFSLEEIMRGGEPLRSIDHLMSSVELKTFHLGWAVAHIFFDLTRLLDQSAGKNNPFEPFIHGDIEVSQIYLDVVGLYEGKPPEETKEFGEEFSKVTLDDTTLDPSSANVENDGQERFDECLDDRVKRLQASGLTPTSILDVYHILTGDTTGSNESETEALKQVAILTVPILISAGLKGEPTHVKCIVRTLLQWEDDDDVKSDFAAVALAELGNVYPEIVASCLEKILFGNNISMGDKGLVLKITQKALIQCGTNRCISCWSEYGPDKKNAMFKFINSHAPAYFSKYLHLSRPIPLCITCPLSTELAIEYVENRENVQPLMEGATTNDIDVRESLERVQSENRVFAPNKLQPLRRMPKTRRWGTPKRAYVEEATPSQRTLHSYIWPIIYHQLCLRAEDFTKLNDDIETYFLIQLLEFSKILFTTYTGLNVYMENASKNVMKLLVCYENHPSRRVREALCCALEATFTNMSLVNNSALPERAGKCDDYLELIEAGVGTLE